MKPKIILLYLASQFGRYISKFSLLSLVCFLASGVKGQVHLLSSSTKVSITSKNTEKYNSKLNVFVRAAYRI